MRGLTIQETNLLVGFMYQEKKQAALNAQILYVKEEAGDTDSLLALKKVRYELTEILKKKGPKKEFLVLLEHANQDGFAAVCIRFDAEEVCHCTYVDYVEGESCLSTMPALLAEVYSGTEIQHIGKPERLEEGTGGDADLLQGVSFIHELEQLLMSEEEVVTPGLVVVPRDLRERYERLLTRVVDKEFVLNSYGTYVREISKSSAIIFLAYTVLTASVFVNQAMFSQQSDSALESSVIVLTFQRVLWALGSNPLSSIQTNIAQAMVKNPKDVGRIVQAGYLLALMLGASTAIIASFAIKPMLTAFGMSESISSTSASTFAASAPGLVGYSILGANMRIMSALGKNQIPLLANFIGSGIGIGAVYLLMHGAGAIPALGPAGLGWGQSVQMWVSCLPPLIYLLTSSARKDYHLFSLHAGLLREIYRNFKQGMAMFAQRNADVFAAFGMAIMAGKVGNAALIAENVAETYRMLFGRVGANSISQALTSVTAAMKARLDLAVEGKLRVPHDTFHLAVDNMRRARWGAYAPSAVYGGAWLALYFAIPKQLSSLFIASDSGYQGDSQLASTVASVLWMSGIGQCIDDVRQVQMGDLNARKSFGIANWLPTVLNFVLMLGTAGALAFSADQGAFGLETANAAWFFISLFAFQAILTRETHRLESRYDASLPGSVTVHTPGDVIELSPFRRNGPGLSEPLLTEHLLTEHAPS